ncbi:tape measure protein [Rudanella paleaurantiibacter]|uniref:Tape measure protein n=1 Tax=Rudanella paleaurantiibacter TaxID=2614655 RepID=A0A7J5TYJ7_9BACT|nr:tape measure protein [Rudanella paleaurantiibacter]KAB7730135.1 tape measure protein [Rudanella paleaurantiibacter]
MDARSLSVALGLDDRPFAQGLNRASQNLSQWAGRMQQTGSRALGQLSSNMNGASRSARNMGAQLSAGFGAPMNSLGGLITRLGGLYSAFELAKRGLTIISDLNRLERGLQAVSSSTEDFNRSQAFVQATSQSLGLEYQSLTKAYVGLKAATIDTAIEGAQTEKIFTAVGKASAALGLTTEQTEGSLLALQQMMSKGTVSAEELRGQLGERLPGAFRLMAQGLGVSESKLGKMLEQGQVLSAVALPKLAEQLEKTYGASAQNGLKGMAGGWSKVTTEVQLLLKALDNKLAIDEFFGSILTGLANMTSQLGNLIQSTSWKEFTDLLKGRMSIGELVDSAAVQGYNQKERNKALSSFRSMSPKERQAEIKKLRDDLETSQQMVNTIATKPYNAASEKRAIELESYNKLTGQKLNDLQWEDEELRKQEAINAARLKNAKTGGGNKAADKAVYVPKSGYEGLVTERNRLEGRINDIQSTGSKNPKIMAELQLLQRAFSAVDAQIKEIDESWQNFENRGAELEITIRPDGVATELLGFRGQAGGANFRPGDTSMGQTRPIGTMPKMPTAEEFRNNVKPDLSAEHLRQWREVEAQKAQSYRVIDRSFMAEDAEIVKARFDQIYDAVIAGGGSIEDAMRKANEVVTNSGEALQQNLSGILQTTAADAMAGFGELLGGMLMGVRSLEELPAMIGRLFGQMAKQMGKAMIAFGTAGIAAKAFLANPAGAIVAGIALTALGAMLEASMQSSMQSGMSSGLPKYASGGVFDSPSVGLFAEYPGAQWNKEIATPEKLMGSVFRRELVDYGMMHNGTAEPGRRSVDVRIAPVEVKANAHEMKWMLQQVDETQNDIYG